ncbi:hypothetical protein B0533_03630 [Sedimentibacter sp. SX930]|nr:hypothetical protein B0533_03630 [Sedimentibacter sp. SX930]
MVLEQFIIDADIIWDQVGKTFFENPEAKPGRIMRVQVVNAGIIEDLTGYTLNLGWTSVRDPSKFGLDAFDDVDITKGIFEIAYTTGMLTNIGPLNASLLLVPPGEGRPIESNNFKLTVKNSAINASAIQGETSFSTLENALVEVNGWNARIDVVEQEFKDRAEALDGAYPVRLTAAEQAATSAVTVANTASQKADAMASGSPKGVYATLALLQAAYPTGTTGAYLVSADGKWYYWSGSTWTIGGVYQATELGIGAVTDDKINSASKLGMVTDDLEVNGILKSVNVNPIKSYGSLSANLSPSYAGMSVPFVYHGIQHKYILIPYLKTTYDAFVTFAIANLTIDCWGTQTKGDVDTLTYFDHWLVAGEYTNLMIPVAFNYTPLVAETEYLLLVQSMQNIGSPTYSSQAPFQVKKNNSTTTFGPLVSAYLKTKFLLNYGAYAWGLGSPGQIDYVLPPLELIEDIVQVSDIDTYVDNKIMSVTLPITDYVPDEIELIKNDDVEIFYDSIFSVKRIENYRLDVTNGLGTYHNRKAIIQPVDATVDKITNVKVYNDYEQLVSECDLNFKVYPVVNPSAPKNLLIIGDSLTEYGEGSSTVNTLYSKLQSKGMTNINFIGTKNAAGNALAKHEGRAGWRTWDYLGVGTTGNPFVYNGIVDFGAYCTANGYSGIDYCIIHMNWNAIMFSTETMVSNLSQLVDKVKASYPNAIVFIVGMSAYRKGRYTGDFACSKLRAWEVDAAYKVMAATKTNVKAINLLPYRDMDYGNVYNTSQVNLRNATDTERLLSDHVHCGAVGYMQIADVYFRKLAKQTYLESL